MIHHGKGRCGPQILESLWLYEDRVRQTRGAKCVGLQRIGGVTARMDCGPSALDLLNLFAIIH